MKYKLIISLVFMLLPVDLFSQELYTIRGIVTDDTTGEALIGASVKVRNSEKGTVSDGNGNFNIEMPQGNYVLDVFYLGYKQYEQPVALNNNLTISISLSQEVYTADEVIITEKNPKDHVLTTETGVVELKMKDISKLPSLMGETDIIKILQLSPGMQTTGEGDAAFYVRGGSADQNLVLLDEIVIYNPAHFLGFFSVFNSDAIQEAKLTKSGMPANYGGRLASVIEVESKDGDYDAYHINGGIGLISSKLTLQGPFQKSKSSFLITGRRTYIDEVMKPVIKKVIGSEESKIGQSGYYFYDVNAKLTYRVSDKTRLSLTLYQGGDQFNLNDEEISFNNNLRWGNRVIGVNWNQILSENWYSRNTSGFTKYEFHAVASQEEIEITAELHSVIEDYSNKLEFTHIGSNDDKIKTGADYRYHHFMPNNIGASLDEDNLDFGSNRNLYSHELSVFYNQEKTLLPVLKVNYGLRLTGFIHVGPYDKLVRNEIGEIRDTIPYSAGELIKEYFHFEPRISARYLLNENTAIKASFNRNNQDIHMATTSSVTIPADVWLPSTLYIKPQKGTQYSVGVYKIIGKQGIYCSIDLYYKNLRNQIELMNGILNNFRDNIFEESIVFGKGESKGMEFFIRKNAGKLNGWVSYTLSRTTRQFDTINDGMIYPAKYDRRHDLNLAASYKLSERWSVSGILVYATGSAFTIPSSKYLISMYVIGHVEETNSFRMPAYHRLDASLTYNFKKTGRFESTLNLSVLNVYNRPNPFFIYFQIDGNIQDGITVKPKQVVLLPIMPSLTWNFRF